MKIDARVSKLKFELEVERISAQAAALQKRGVLIQKIQYPVVEAIFIPRKNVALCLPVELPPDGSLPPGSIRQLSIEYHAVTGKAFGARIFLDDFDQRAPSVVFCDPFTWEELTYDKLHRGNHIGSDNKAFNVILDAHPLTKKPFLCMRGIREYHEHPQHTGDDWMQYRKYVGLSPVIDTIWHTCVYHANPNLMLHPFAHVLWTPTGAV